MVYSTVVANISQAKQGILVSSIILLTITVLGLTLYKRFKKDEK